MGSNPKKAVFRRTPTFQHAATIEGRALATACAVANTG